MFRTGVTAFSREAWGLLTFLSVLGFLPLGTLQAETLEDRLRARPLPELIQRSMTEGDAARGAIVFHQASVGCAKCHLVEDQGDESLGPNLAKLRQLKPHDNRHIVESILTPSAVIRDGYQTISVLKIDGSVVTGLLISDDDDATVLRNVSTGEPIRIEASDIDDVSQSKTSVMPTGIVSTFSNERAFYDLVKYVIEVRDGGAQRARQLQPAAALVEFRLPEYESRVDHAGLVSALDDKALERGQQIYERLCVNCHGTVDQPGSLPTALRFAEGKFKVGSDPYSMYHTLTHGFGLMVPQTWMVPRQKYDVTHYIREHFVKPHNRQQYEEITPDYVEALPKGDTFGPEPTESMPWSDMDYGPWMFNTVEVGNDGTNIAYKGLAVRVDPGPGGVARGNQWMLFDHDTFRVAAAWSHDPDSKSRFIDWRGIHFDGRHQAHPHAAGEVAFSNPTGPGWAHPATGRFDDDARVEGRDGKRYGPLPSQWAKYNGLYQRADRVAVSYRIGETDVLEAFDALDAVDDQQAAFVRLMEIQPSRQTHVVSLATDPAAESAMRLIGNDAVAFGRDLKEAAGKTAAHQAPPAVLSGEFDGTQWLQIEKDASRLDPFAGDFTITATVKTESDGVIFASTLPGPEWVPDGCVFFIRGGRLGYDVGWVGAVQSRKNVADGRSHKIALVWTKSDQRVSLFADGKKVGGGELAPRKSLEKSIVRIGRGADDFPRDTSLEGQLKDVRFYRKALSAKETQSPSIDESELVGRWISDKDVGPSAEVVNDTVARANNATRVMAGIAGDTEGCEFRTQEGRLCLSIPAAKEVRKLAIWTARRSTDDSSDGADWSRVAIDRNQRAAVRLSQEGWCQKVDSSDKPLWPEVLTTAVTMDSGVDSASQNGFAVDILNAPESNPWLARLRFSGLDFFAGGDAMAISTWDGDVYHVDGLLGSDDGTPPVLRWRRIASGLFQPLGVKIVDGTVYITCRDQLVVLRDRNGDGGIDFYQCFNNDHQVTEHFHEFAMGLQRDDAGNFYYAKSARHALTALVPHHGTLLRVSPDGEKTEIVATGFRAANGVCLNADGTFIVTDQEGHWNPKNRINWVTEGGFYGNMYGYHDVTDESDEAMDPPLCWITNAFDRSPSELLWVDSPRWGNLNGTLLNLSYGYGKVYTVPHQHLDDGRVQGGMCTLPIAQFPTGTMRGRFNPSDGQLYVCGLFAWGSSQQTKEGGLYRIRYEGERALMPVANHASGDELSVTFSDPVDAESAEKVTNYGLTTWSLRRTKNYGSKHYDEAEQTISAVRVSADGRTVTLTIPGLKPTWCYELQCDVRRDGDAQSQRRVIHGTIHEL